MLRPNSSWLLRPARSWPSWARRRLGGAWALDGLWRQLGIDDTLRGLLADRRIDARAERLVLAMVANRALAASSKRACAGWADADVHIPGLAEVGEDPQPLYRAMDWLLEVETDLAEAVYWATADLLNLEVDLLFFDTTSTYFETRQPTRSTRTAVALRSGRWSR